MHPSDRVLRVAQHVRGRVGGERGLQPGQVQAPAVGPVSQRDLQDPGARLGHPVEERRIDRRTDHDRVPRAGQYPEQFDHTDPDIGHRRYRGRVQVPVPAAGREPRDGPAEIREGMSVPGVGPLDGLAQDVRDGRGEREVHLGHGQRQHVGGVGLPLRTAPAPQHVKRVDRQHLGSSIHDDQPAAPGQASAGNPPEKAPAARSAIMSTLTWSRWPSAGPASARASGRHVGPSVVAAVFSRASWPPYLAERRGRRI